MIFTNELTKQAIVRRLIELRKEGLIHAIYCDGDRLKIQFKPDGAKQYTTWRAAQVSLGIQDVPEPPKIPIHPAAKVPGGQLRMATEGWRARRAEYLMETGRA